MIELDDKEVDAMKKYLEELAWPENPEDLIEAEGSRALHSAFRKILGQP